MEFRYCPNCKNEVKLQQERLLECKACGFTFYLNPAPTNALIIENENGEILLTIRKIEPKKGFYDLPGGFVEYNETVEESMKREIQEELGTSINSFAYLGSYYGEYIFKGFTYHPICIAFYGTLNNPESIKPADDIESIEWIKKDAIPFDKVASKEVKEALADYLRRISR